jgi:SAM-dependent MidA family methyltransferase
MPPSTHLSPELPQPDADDAALSAALCERIRNECRAAGGAVAFDAYMELALYTPQLGYYSAPRSRFGTHGDFVTAPEISERFAVCVARQVAQILGHIGGGGVLEAGAGSGVLADGVISALTELGHREVDYAILERSAGARGFQRERLAAHGARVRWLDDFPAAGFRGVLIANELLDAIPARRFEVRGRSAHELGVAWGKGRFEWREIGPAPDVTEALGPLLDALPNGYLGEFAPARAAWVHEAASRLEAGALLLLDYGYPRHELYHPQRLEGTLACHYRHRVHGDPFLWPGLQDLSVHVDFTALAAAGAATGTELAGYTPQAHFLLDTGLLQGLDDPGLDERSRIRLTAQIQRLTLPGEMGEAVKVMALTRGVTSRPCGFLSRDLSHRL